MLGESVYLLLDLMGKLSDIAKDQSSASVSGLVVELMQDTENENSCFTHTRYSLAHNVSSFDSVRDALLLNLRGMLETAIGDCSVEFLLQQEVFETSGMNACVTSCLGARFRLILILDIIG